MNEELLETANLYVLGLLTEADAAAFEQELRSSSALQREVHSLQEAVLGLARSAPAVPPPADLRAQVLSGFAALESGSKPASRAENPSVRVLPATPSSSPRPASPGGFKILHFIPWAASAAMAVLIVHDRRALQSAQQQAASAQADSAHLKARENHLLEAVAASGTARNSAETALAATRESLARAETALAALTREKETLLAEVTRLQETSELDKTRIAVLGSILKNQPQAVAVSLWRQHSQEGLLVVENMPALPPGRDYQLWVIDPQLKSPVSAGVFKVDASGKVRLEFKPTRPVQSAFKFAVTVEKEGGSPTPTLDQMVVIGG